MQRAVGYGFSFLSCLLLAYSYSCNTVAYLCRPNFSLQYNKCESESRVLVLVQKFGGFEFQRPRISKFYLNEWKLEPAREHCLTLYWQRELRKTPSWNRGIVVRLLTFDRQRNCIVLARQCMFRCIEL